MRAAVMLAAVAAVAAAPRTAVKDGSVASAAFRVVSNDVAQLPWHGNDASGAAAKQKRHDDAPDLDQIIVEALEQPAKHRHSAALIIFIAITSLFVGVVVLLLCIVCFLKAFHGQIAYQSVTQKDDRLCVVENRGRPLTDVLFNKPPVDKSKEVRDEVRRDVRSSSYSAPNRFEPEHTKENSRKKTALSHDRPPGFDAMDLEYGRESVRRKSEYGAPTADTMAEEYARESARRKAMSRAPPPSRYAQQRRDYGSEEMNYDEPECPQPLSNLQLNLRINQDRPSSRNTNVPWGYRRNQAREGSSLTSVSAGEDYGRTTKSQPLMFSLNPLRKANRPRDGRALVAEPKLPRARELPSAWRSNSRESMPSSEEDENFFGEQNASEIFQTTKSTNVRRDSRGKAESMHRETPKQQPGYDTGGQHRAASRLGHACYKEPADDMLIDELLIKKGPEKRDREGE